MVWVGCIVSRCRLTLIVISKYDNEIYGQTTKSRLPDNRCPIIITYNCYVTLVPHVA